MSRLASRAARIKLARSLGAAADGDIVARMPEAAQIESCRVVGRYGEVDPELLARLTTLADDYGFGRHMRSLGQVLC